MDKSAKLDLKLANEIANLFFQTILAAFSDRIGGLAYEPFAKQIYYSLQYNRSILTKAVDGSNLSRSLPLTVIARSLVIDSFLARMCWMHSDNGILECSSLSGENLVTIYEANPFEIKIMELALDGRSHYLYFMIQVYSFETAGKIQVLI